LASLQNPSNLKAATQEATLRSVPLGIPNNVLTVWGERLILAADLGGTFVFAVEGALAAIQAQLDLLGVMVVSFITALGGGIIRDVLIGATPPSAIRDSRYPLVALAGGGLTFLFYAFISSLPVPLIIRLDALGLALFAVAGTQKALAFGIRPLIAAALGTVTAVGGGMTRDMMLNKIPAILRVDVYATAALAGSLTMIAARRMGLPLWAGSLLGFVVCVALRRVAVARHWNLPKVTGF
jgi:uncharacterized membrane protein YeiH